jgi:hypothetical protein
LQKATRGQVARHVTQLLYALAVAEAYDVIKTTLQGVAWFHRFFPQNGRDKFTRLSGPRLLRDEHGVEILGQKNQGV